MGPCELAPEYSHLRLTEQECRESPTKRVTNLKKMGPNSVSAKVTNTIMEQLSQKTLGLPDCESSALPGNFSTDWERAKKFIREDEIIPSPSAENCFLVKSDSNPKQLISAMCMHRKVTCGCERFMNSDICAHAIEVAFLKECLEYFIASWQPNLGNIIAPAVPEKSGAKINEKRKRRRHPPIRRNTANKTRRLKGSSYVLDNDKFYVLLLKDTYATKCYGCTGRLRPSENHAPPSLAFDMILGRKVHRVYQKSGTETFTITKNKENACYHPTLKCVKKKCPDFDKSKLEIDGDILKELSISH